MNALIQCAECDGPPKVVVPPFHNGEPVTKFWIGCCSSWRSAFEWSLERTCLAWNYRNTPAEAENSYVIKGDAT